MTESLRGSVEKSVARALLGGDGRASPLRTTTSLRLPRKSGGGALSLDFDARSFGCYMAARPIRAVPHTEPVEVKREVRVTLPDSDAPRELSPDERRRRKRKRRAAKRSRRKGR